MLAILWFYKIYADPRHVFWAMIRNNLSTSSVIKQSLRTSGSSTDKEYIQIVFNPEVLVHDVQNVTSHSGPYTSKLTLETIGTALDDYQRYSHVERPQSKLTQTDYQKIYNLWLKNGGRQGARGQLVANTLFGASLFGNFDAATRSRLMAELATVYQVDFGSVIKQTGSRRRTYQYHVLIPLQKYAVVARDYAQTLGLPLASQINPDNYRPTDELIVNMTVDVLGRQLRKIDYTNQGLSENYSGQGDTINISPPAKTVSADTFNKAINSLNK